jgi:hypothetical protein
LTVEQMVVWKAEMKVAKSVELTAKRMAVSMVESMVVSTAEWMVALRGVILVA